MNEKTDIQEPLITSSKQENPVLVLVEIMKNVLTNTPEAKLNAISISDGKGGRIRL